MAFCALHGEREATGSCARCERAVCGECGRSWNGRTYCASCVEELERKLAARAVAPEVHDGSAFGPAPIEPAAPAAGLGLPVLVAVAAGVAGAFLWYLSVVATDMKLGLVAVGVGLLVGFATSKAAGGRGGPRLAIASLLVALGAMALGEYLIVNHYVLAQVAKDDPGADLPSFIPFGVFTSVYGQSLGAMDFVFYAIGAYEAWKIPARAARAS